MNQLQKFDLSLKYIVPLMLFLGLSLLTTCEEEAEIPEVTCEINGEKWESVSTKCDLYIDELCKQRSLKLVASATGGNQLVLSLYNYQDSVCDGTIGLYDYFIDNNNNQCVLTDTLILCREVISHYRTGSGIEYFSGEDVEDKITITSCDAVNKTISGSFNIHFYKPSDGALAYEAVSGIFEDVEYYLHDYY